MAFNNYYGNGMSGYGQPYYNNTGAVPDQLAQYRAQQYQQFPPQQPYAQPPVVQPPASQIAGNGLLWVQGEEAAKAYLVANGNSVVLWDSEKPVVYLKSADETGKPSLRIFDINERLPFAKEPPQTISMADYITRKEFSALEDKLNELLEKGNHQQTNKNTEIKYKQKEDKGNG